MRSRGNQTIDLQPRDVAILRGLFDSRVATASQLTALYFDGKAEAAKRRLWRLKAAGLITERSRRPYEPAVLFLTRHAFQLLDARGHLQAFPRLGIEALARRVQVSEQTLRHELDVMAVKTSITVAVKSETNLSVEQFTTWPLLCSFKTTGFRGDVVTVKPDGFLTLRELSGEAEYHHAFFLEVDRSTESLEVVAKKIRLYLRYYREGGFAARNGIPPGRYKEAPFRVIIVCRSEERKHTIAGALFRSDPPILTFAVISTLPDVAAEPLGAVWVHPKDPHSRGHLLLSDARK